MGFTAIADVGLWKACAATSHSEMPSLANPPGFYKSCGPFIVIGMSTNSVSENANKHDREPPAQKEPIPAELISLFRILLKKPPQGHDFKTCPVCKKYGIAEI